MAVMREAEPAVASVSTYEEVASRMGKGNLVVIGLFDEEDVDDSLDGSQGGAGAGPYHAFQSAADTLKGYADFLVAGSHDLDEAFEVDSRPAVLYLGKSNAVGKLVPSRERG